ncbi:MAG: hypothetical protein AAF658_01090 [Myxococcota bacterium]
MSSSLAGCRVLDVRGLFAEHRWVLPEGEGAHRWEKRTCGAFLNHWLLPDSRRAFLGALVVGARPSEGPQTIVDGVQRLVLISLALSALRQLSEELGTRHGLELSRCLAAAEFGSPLTARLVARDEPHASALHHLLLEPTVPMPSVARSSKLPATQRNIRRWFDQRLAESDDAQRTFAETVQRALEGGEVALVELSPGADMERERQIIAGRLPIAAPALPTGDEQLDPDHDDQWPLVVGPPKVLPKLSPELTYSGTVWIPRILWALEWALRHQLGAQTASDIARLLHEHAHLAVANTNIARAFRHHRRDSECQRMWREVEPLRYEILSHGRVVLGRVLQPVAVT